MPAIMAFEAERNQTRKSTPTSNQDILFAEMCLDPFAAFKRPAPNDLDYAVRLDQNLPVPKAQFLTD